MTRGTFGDRSRRLLLAATGASVICWFVPGLSFGLYPIRLLVTLVHEGAHAVTGVLTGGSVEGISVHVSGNGLTKIAGGMPVFIYPAGYVGTMVLGTALLMAVSPRRGKEVLAVLAAMIAAVTIAWVRDPLAVVVGAGWCVLLLLLRKYLASAIADFISGFLAVQLCLNAVLDLRGLIWMTTNTSIPNDAVLMAERYGLAPWFWAILWAALALAILAGALHASWHRRRS